MHIARHFAYSKHNSFCPHHCDKLNKLDKFDKFGVFIRMQFEHVDNLSQVCFGCFRRLWIRGRISCCFMFYPVMFDVLLAGTLTNTFTSLVLVCLEFFGSAV